MSDASISGRPDFIPADVFRTWLKPQYLNRYAIIGGIQPASFANREVREGRPIKSIGSPAQYRLLDIVARARALCLSVEPVEAVRLERSIESLKAEELALRVTVDSARHALSMNLASLYLTNATLLTEAEIVAGGVQYQPKCGVYFLIARHKVRYVGQSVNVESRLRDHQQRFEFDSVAYMPCESAILDRMESLYIHMLRPEWNGRLNTREGDFPVAPLTLVHLLGGTDGTSMSAIKAAEFNRMRKEEA